MDGGDKKISKYIISKYITLHNSSLLENHFKLVDNSRIESSLTFSEFTGRYSVCRSTKSSFLIKPKSVFSEITLSLSKAISRELIGRIEHLLQASLPLRLALAVSRAVLAFSNPRDAQCAAIFRKTKFSRNICEDVDSDIFVNGINDYAICLSKTKKFEYACEMLESAIEIAGLISENMVSNQLSDCNVQLVHRCQPNSVSLIKSLLNLSRSIMKQPNDSVACHFQSDIDERFAADIELGIWTDTALVTETAQLGDGEREVGLTGDFIFTFCVLQ